MCPCNQGTKIGIPKVFRRIPKNSSTNICGAPRNPDSYPPNTLAIRGVGYFQKELKPFSCYVKISYASKVIE
jgi:hypothetical protein